MASIFPDFSYFVLFSSLIFLIKKLTFVAHILSMQGVPWIFYLYEEVVISFLSDNHDPSNIPLFVTDENLNLWISLGSSFDINGLLSVRLFQSRMQEVCQDEIFQM